MKHLNLFEDLFDKLNKEKQVEIIETIQDICQDLTDDGFSYSIVSSEDSTFHLFFWISIHKSNSLGHILWFNVKDIQHVVDRLEGYLKSEGIYHETRYHDLNIAILMDCVSFNVEVNG